MFNDSSDCDVWQVECPQKCLEYVCFDVLDHHIKELCTKRPAEPIFCRLGCGMSFGGLVETLLLAENERLMHETEQCDMRIVRDAFDEPALNS